MTAKQKIIEFMNWKQERIQEICKEAIPYFIEEDEAEINAWNDNNCDKIWKHIITKNLYGRMWDRSICPFCVDASASGAGRSCFACSYSKRHGECSSCDMENTYGHILLGENRNHSSLCDVLGFGEIREKIKELDAKADK